MIALASVTSQLLLIFNCNSTLLVRYSMLYYYYHTYCVVPGGPESNVQRSFLVTVDFIVTTTIDRTPSKVGTFVHSCVIIADER